MSGCWGADGGEGVNGGIRYGSHGAGDPAPTNSAMGRGVWVAVAVVSVAVSALSAPHHTVRCGTVAPSTRYNPSAHP
jgi:hypothetical protein